MSAIFPLSNWPKTTQNATASPAEGPTSSQSTLFEPSVESTTPNGKTLDPHAPQQQQPSSHQTIIVEPVDPKLSISDEQRQKIHTRRIRLTLFITLLVDMVLPLAIYFILQQYISLTWALFAAGIPPLLGAVFKFVRTRKLDLLGIVIVIGVVISLALALITDNPVFLLLRESVMTGFKGLIDILSLIPFHYRGFTLRPLMFYVARALLPHAPVILPNGSRIDWFDYCWTNMPRFRRHFNLLTLIWGVGLLVEFGVRLTMIFLIADVNKVVLISTAVIAVWINALAFLTFRWGKHIRRDADEDFIALGLDGRLARSDEWVVQGW